MKMTVQRIKAAVRERDGLQCTECGLCNRDHKILYDGQLQVHRVVPGSEYTLEGCVTLCKVCHYSKPRRKYGTAIDNGQTRLTLDISKECHDALRLAASHFTGRKKGTIKAVATEILRENLASALEEVRKARTTKKGK